MKHGIFCYLILLVLATDSAFSVGRIQEVSPEDGRAYRPGAPTINDEIHIFGEGFENAQNVMFGGQSADGFTVISDNEIIATLPVGVPQVVEVRVITSDGSSEPNRASKFTYTGSWHGFVANSNSGTLTVFEAPRFHLARRRATFIGNFSVGFGPESIGLSLEGDEVGVSNFGRDLEKGSAQIFFVATNNLLFPENSPVRSRYTGMTYQSRLFDPLCTFPILRALFLRPGVREVVEVDRLGDLIRQFPVGRDPIAMSSMPDGEWIAVANYRDGSISFLDLERGPSGTETLRLGGGARPWALLWTEGGQPCAGCNQGNVTLPVLFALDETRDSLWAISPPPNARVISRIPVGKKPVAAAVLPSPDNGLCLEPGQTRQPNQIYVANYDNREITVINADTYEIITRIRVGKRPVDLAVAGNKIFVANLDSGTITVIDGITNQIIKTIRGHGLKAPRAIAGTPDGGTIYAVDERMSRIFFIDAHRNELYGSIPAEDGATAIALMPDQAPKAAFSATLVRPGASRRAGAKYKFDASNSISPTGFIERYDWDFGDGITLSTTNKTVFHTYSAPGVYEAALTVTNSAGTSKEKKFQYSTTTNPNTRVNNTTSIISNGGPSATTSQTINIPYSEPIISNVQLLAPSTQLRAEDRKVEIRGSHFSCAAEVLIDGRTAAFTVESDSIINAIAPPGEITEFTVISPGGISSLFKDN